KALGPDKIATVSTNGSLKVWNTEEGGVLLTLFPSGVGELDAKIGQVSQAVFTPSGDALGVCVPGETPTVTAFDMNTEEVRATISLPEPVQCLAMSEEAVYVQTDSKLSRFDLDGRAAGSWSLPPTPERPPTKSLLGWEVGGAPECAYSLGAGVVALSQTNGSSITFLEGKTLTPIRTVSTPPVYRMCFSPDGERLVITHRTGIAIYETRTGEATGDGIDWKVPDEIPGPGYQPFWVSESRIVLFNGYSDDIYPSLLDWEVGKKPIGDKLEQGGKSAALDGQGALVIGTFDGTILVEETPGRYRELAAKSGQVTTMAESPDGSLVFGTTWGDIVFWDGKTGQPTRRFQVSGTVEALDLSPDGRFLGAVVSEKPGRKAMFWDLETGETTSVMNSDNREIVDAICLLNGGKAYVVNFERQTDILVDVRSGEVLARRAARGPTDTVYIAEKDWILQLSSMNLFTVLDASDNLSQVVEYKLPFQIYTGLRPDPQRKSLYICGIPTALCKWDLDAPEKAPETLYLDPLRAEKQYQGGLGIVVDEDRIFLATIDGLLHQFDKSGTITKEINLHVQLAKDHQRLKSGRIAFLTRGRVAFADPESGKLLGYLGLLPDNEGWAAIARDGTFDGNEEGLARIDIRIGNKHYSMGQLF
ncbi:MAG: WD40 repeat domain-containing protein, partial [Candidatus Eremiobacteraeota bacterium]|nr:WD40 repeat domain-containing protein [Candidatus Eremiobacteraeota bacterium]